MHVLIVFKVCRYFTIDIAIGALIPQAPTFVANSNFYLIYVSSVKHDFLMNRKTKRRRQAILLQTFMSFHQNHISIGTKRPKISG